MTDDDCTPLLRVLNIIFSRIRSCNQIISICVLCEYADAQIFPTHQEVRMGVFTFFQKEDKVQGLNESKAAFVQGLLSVEVMMTWTVGARHFIGPTV